MATHELLASSLSWPRLSFSSRREASLYADQLERRLLALKEKRSPELLRSDASELEEEASSFLRALAADPERLASSASDIRCGAAQLRERALALRALADQREAELSELEEATDELFALLFSPLR